MTLDLNLETLKREILDYLERSEFAVFYSNPGGLESMPLVLWDVARFPDYRMYLDVARQAGVKLVLFAAAELESHDLDELKTQIEEGGLSREDTREYLSRLRSFRSHEGSICSLELAFDYNSRLYVYDVQPDWYEEFLNLEDEIMAELPELGDDDMGGYFSKN